jgi:hypothetical protein
LRRTQEAFQAQGAVRRRPELVQLVGLDQHVTPRPVLEAANNGGGIDGAMLRTLFGVAEALTAVGVQEVSGGQVADANGGVGLEGDTDQAELQQPGPTGPAGRCHGGRREGSR